MANVHYRDLTDFDAYYRSAEQALDTPTFWPRTVSVLFLILLPISFRLPLFWISRSATRGKFYMEEEEKTLDHLYYQPDAHSARIAARRYIVFLPFTQSRDTQRFLNLVLQMLTVGLAWT